MRILQLAPIWETVPPPAYGGTETVIHALTEELVRRGHEVTLCASGDSCTSAELLSVFPRSLRTAGLGDDALQYALVHVATALRQAGSFDIVHNHSGPPSEIAMGLSSLTDVPMLTTLHNLLGEETRFIWSNYTGWYNAISRTQERSLPSMPLANNAGVVYNGMDVGSFPFREQKDGFLLFIGRMTLEKAPHLAVEVAQRLGQRIVIAGKISTEDEKLYFKHYVEPLLCLSGVEYVGEADARLKRDLFSRANALLQPLQWEEPFGLVMIESMACGTPVVVYRRGAASEVVLDGETGFIVDDLDAMVAATRRVGELDPRRCREHVEANFSCSALADAYLAVYEKIIREETARHEPQALSV